MLNRDRTNVAALALIAFLAVYVATHLAVAISAGRLG